MRVWMLVLGAGLLGGCLKSTKGFGVPQANSLAPSPNVFLRNSFDTDPSTYLGRFIPEGLEALDESAGMSLACSEHISWRYVEGGGVKYTEFLQASSEASARLGVPVFASAKGKGSSNSIVRVEYELTGKMIAEIDDPVAFNACCDASPDQCTTRYVGEFIQGTGSVYHLSDTSMTIDAQGAHPAGVGGDVDVDHGISWKRAVEFPNPIYFAFKVAGTGHQQASTGTCSSWGEAIPIKEGRSYVIGVSREAKTESMARNQAINNATFQAAAAGLIEYEFIGEELPPGTVTAVNTEDWCVEATETDKGTRYVARVLAWAPDADAVAAPILPVEDEDEGEATDKDAPSTRPPAHQSGGSDSSSEADQPTEPEVSVPTTPEAPEGAEETTEAPADAETPEAPADSEDTDEDKGPRIERPTEPATERPARVPAPSVEKPSAPRVGTGEPTKPRPGRGGLNR